MRLSYDKVEVMTQLQTAVPAGIVEAVHLDIFDMHNALINNNL